ncbi:MAG: hypothetical protein HY017_06270 [Betaproteobacteria bacterium]|nr:hypothetical protein [Betaproteobacteria bacterium]
MNTAQLDSPGAAAGESWEAANAWCLENDMTDGLPIVPPTEDRVRLMTDYVERTLGWARAHVIATLAPKSGAASVEAIAANAVMAGCIPEYMPVLIASVQALALPKFNLDAVQTSTHNTSALAVVNGPIRNAIDLNCGYNHTGSRWRSTATIGRAIRLIMANIGGTPGSVNIHTQGHIARFEHCVGENEEQSPWEPLSVERGHPAGASTVTMIPACPASMIDDNGGSQTAKELLRTFAHSLPSVGNRNYNGEGQPALILCPQHAQTFANGGYSKAEVKQFLWERGRLRFGDIPRGNLVNYSRKNMKMYADIDADYGIPIAETPEDIVIVVMGGTGTHSLSVQTQIACKIVTVAIAHKDGSLFRS